MITIKQIGRYEDIIKNIHPIILLLCGIVVLLLSKTISLILYNSNGVGLFIIGDFTSGIILRYQISYIEIIVNINYLISIIFNLIIIFIIYFGFKIYLNYKQDNL